jgi:hypothetical protein
MMLTKTHGRLWLATCAALSVAARADVTTEQQATFDLSIIKAHGTTTEYTTADKQRSDSTLNCEGLLSLVCGNAQNGEIIRLDRDLTWTLDPKKKEYRETPFLTAAERKEAEQQAQAMLAKLQQCPAAHNAAPAPDTSKCQMSPPKIESRQTDKHAAFAGHDAKLSQLALTQSCKNNDTGDVCDFVITLDAWLTQDQIAGLDEQRAFRKAHLQKLGLEDRNSMVAKQLRQFLAPYADSLKELGSKAGDFQGYPLKTAVRIAFGGPHCGAAQKDQATGGSGGGTITDASQAASEAAASSAAGAAGSAAGAAASNAAGNSVAGSVLGSAASAFGSKLVSGLFSKKKADAGSAAASGATGSEGSLAPGMIQAAQFTIETTSITPGPVPATQFEIPANWKLAPAPKEKAPKEFTCPTG